MGFFRGMLGVQTIAQLSINASVNRLGSGDILPKNMPGVVVATLEYKHSTTFAGIVQFCGSRNLGFGVWDLEL